MVCSAKKHLFWFNFTGCFTLSLLWANKILFGVFFFFLLLWTSEGYKSSVEVSVWLTVYRILCWSMQYGLTGNVLLANPILFFFYDKYRPYFLFFETRGLSSCSHCSQRLLQPSFSILRMIRVPWKKRETTYMLEIFVFLSIVPFISTAFWCMKVKFTFCENRLN